MKAQPVQPVTANCVRPPCRTPLAGDRAALSAAQASYPVGGDDLVDRGSASAHLPLPVLVFDIRLDSVLPAVSVQPRKAVTSIGDKPLRMASVKTSVLPENRHCRMGVVSILVYEIFRDYSAQTISCIW